MTTPSVKTVTSDLERKSLDSDIKDGDFTSSPAANITTANRRRSAQSDVDHATTTTYPRIAESAPFPALGSVNEVSRIMSRESEVQAPKNDNSSIASEKGGDAVEKPWEKPIETEGWRNPGWLAVVATFLVNFTVFGNSFSWGNFQRL